MPVVQVPKSFFKKERQQLYANWPGAFWRELTQNAADAGARTITIRIEQHDGFIRVHFEDDGPGMDRALLETVYFRLGETTKGGEFDFTALGGFGRARILTCFSMLRYTIRTQNLVVTGEGADYTIDETDAVLRGCHLAIDIDDASMRELDGALRVFLRQSQLGCTVHVNGEPWTTWALRGAFVKKLTCETTEFASVYFRPDGLTKHVIIRSRGLQSYFQISQVPAQVVIEIEPHLLRAVMTGNRDGLLTQYRNAVDAFLDEITLNTSALTRNRFRDGPVHTASTSAFFTSMNLSDDTTNIGHDPETTDVEDVYVFDESDKPLSQRTIKSYCPGGWAKPKREMMMTWKGACQRAVDAMLKVTRTDRLDWAVGWYFGDPATQAVTKKIDGQSLYVFCINPLQHNEFFWYTGDAIDRRRVAAMAKHEVAHAKYFSHDENFATLLTEIDAGFEDDADPEGGERRTRASKLDPATTMKAATMLFSGRSLAEVMTELGITKHQARGIEWYGPPTLTIEVKREGPIDWFQLWELHYGTGGGRRWKTLLQLKDVTYTSDPNEYLSDDFIADLRKRYFRDSDYEVFAKTALEMYPPPVTTKIAWIGFLRNVTNIKAGTEFGRRFAARFNKEHYDLFKFRD